MLKKKSYKGDQKRQGLPGENDIAEGGAAFSKKAPDECLIAGEGARNQRSSSSSLRKSHIHQNGVLQRGGH